MDEDQRSIRAWAKAMARFRQPSALRSSFEIAVTVLAFTAFWSAAAIALAHHIWWGVLLTVPAALFLVRLFMLQHDCGHGSLFAHRGANDWTGRAIGILTFTPYDYWRQTHAVHHASAGNLDERGIGDVTTLTVREYRGMSRLERARYWLYRHPLVMFGLGPAWLFVCQYRVPLGLMRAGARPWISTMATNACILALAVGLAAIMGVVPFLLLQVPVILMAATIGVWLFYVQHQFEETHWATGDEWEFRHAALHGSSHYDLPKALRWLTCNIGIHHVHHMSSKIPFYRLPEVLTDLPELRGMSRITFLQSLACVKLVLWDEDRKRLVSFRQARAA